VNLILCEAHEVGAGGLVILEDGRGAHVRGVLRATPGDTVRIGIIDGPKGQGEILAIDGTRVDLRCRFDSRAPDRPTVDLLLAVPRPKVLKRLWAQLAALGVGRIILTNASRVERPYFDTHVLETTTYRPLLIEGLQQAGDTRLPLVSIHRQFRILIEDELTAASHDELRLVAHPDGGRSAIACASESDHRRALLAIGPEGGWNPFELDLLRQRGFETIGLGSRILRTDTACIALLAMLHEVSRRRGDSDRTR